jgi:hypothetical protein
MLQSQCLQQPPRDALQDLGDHKADDQDDQCGEQVGEKRYRLVERAREHVHETHGGLRRRTTQKHDSNGLNDRPSGVMTAT